MRRKILLATILLLVIGLVTGGCELETDKEEDLLPTRGVGETFKMYTDDVGPFFEIDFTGNVTGRMGYYFDVDHSYRDGIDDPIGNDPEQWAAKNAEYFYQLDKVTAGITAIAFGDDGFATGAKPVAVAKVRPGTRDYEVPLESIKLWINENDVTGYVPGQYIDEPNWLSYHDPILGDEVRAPLTGNAVSKDYDLAEVGLLDVAEALGVSGTKSNSNGDTKKDYSTYTDAGIEPFEIGAKNQHCESGLNLEKVCKKFKGLMNLETINTARYQSREGRNTYKWNWATSANDAQKKCEQSLFYSLQYGGRSGSDLISCLRDCSGSSEELLACKIDCQRNVMGDQYSCGGSFPPDVMSARLVVHRNEPIRWEPVEALKGKNIDCYDYPEGERESYCNAVYSEFVENGVTVSGDDTLSLYVEYADVEANIWGGKLSVSLNGGDPVEYALDKYALKPKHRKNQERIFDTYGTCSEMTDEAFKEYCRSAYTTNSFDDARMIGVMFEFSDQVPDGKIEYAVSLTDGYLWERKLSYVKQLWQGVDEKGYPFRSKVAKTPLCEDMPEGPEKYNVCQQVYCGKTGGTSQTGFFYVESINNDPDSRSTRWGKNDKQFKFWEVLAPHLSRFTVGTGFIDAKSMSSDYLYALEDFDLSIMQGMVGTMTTSYDLYEMDWSGFNAMLFTNTTNLRKSKFNFTDDIESAAFYIDQPLTPGLFTFYGDAGWNIFPKAPAGIENRNQAFVRGDFETTRLPIRLTPAYSTEIKYTGCVTGCDYYIDFLYDFVHYDLEQFDTREDALENCELNVADPYWGCIIDCINLSDNNINGCITFDSCTSSCEDNFHVVTLFDVIKDTTETIKLLTYCDDSPRDINCYSKTSTNNKLCQTFGTDKVKDVYTNLTLSVPPDFLENCVYRRALLVPPDSPDARGCWTKEEIEDLWSMKSNADMKKVQKRLEAEKIWGYRQYNLDQDTCLSQYGLDSGTDNPCLYITRNRTQDERRAGWTDRELCCDTTYEVPINIGVYGIAGNRYEGLPGSYEPVVDIFSEEDAAWDGTTKRQYRISLAYGPKMPLTFLFGTPTASMQSQAYFTAFTESQWVATGFFPPGEFADGAWVWLGMYSYNWQKFPEYEAWALGVVDTEENVIMGAENPYINTINLTFGDLRALSQSSEDDWLDPGADELL